MYGITQLSDHQARLFYLGLTTSLINTNIGIMMIVSRIHIQKQFVVFVVLGAIVRLQAICRLCHQRVNIELLYMLRYKAKCKMMGCCDSTVNTEITQPRLTSDC